MYNSLAEVSVSILSVVLIFNVLSSFSIKELRHRLFFFCVMAAFLSTMTNVYSIHIIQNYQNYPIPFATFVTTIYFIFLGSSPFLFTAYCYTYCSDIDHRGKWRLWLIAIPYIIYLAVVFANLFTGVVFRYDSEIGYVRGSLKMITYAQTTVYAFMMVSIVMHFRKSISKRIVIVFASYPLICLAISLIQFFRPFDVMVGTAAFTPLLLVYLSIQSDFQDYDFSTGLLTERYLEKFFSKNKKCSLVVISIENFSFLQENLGVFNTNQMLLTFGKGLLTEFGGGYAYHIGTERFAVVSTARSAEEMKESVMKVCADNNVFVSEGNLVYPIVTRCVYLSVPEIASTYNEAMDFVNLLLKKTFSNKKSIEYLDCDSNFVEKTKRAKQIATILERELVPTSTQFSVHYQPIYSIAENKFTYMEALARLNGTELGNISPAEFVPIAEKRGLIERLGNTAFEMICKFISENRDVVSHVSVNFSVFQMRNPHVVENVLRTIKKYNISPENIIMEITESIFIDDFNSIKEKMLHLAEAGIVFYLDDFGTGYSNLANVVDLPFTTIKLDRSLVLTMEKNEESRQLFTNVITAFKDKGLKILVEGVESEAQDEIVKAAGADYIQGFLYQRPLPPDDCIELMQKQ